MRTKALATAAVVAIAVLPPPAQVAPAAQSKPARTATAPQKGPPFGPQPGIQGARNPTDLKTILYYAADSLGMLRGGREVDMILTMEGWGTGSMSVDGRPCKLSSYRASIRYRPSEGSQNPRLPVPAMRVDFACAGANG